MHCFFYWWDKCSDVHQTFTSRRMTSPSPHWWQSSVWKRSSGVFSSDQVRKNCVDRYHILQGSWYGRLPKKQSKIRFPFLRSVRPKGTSSGQFEWKCPRRARILFPPKFSEFPRFVRPERKNWAVLIHEQGHSSQNQFVELLRSIENWLVGPDRPNKWRATLRLFSLQNRRLVSFAATVFGG